MNPLRIVFFGSDSIAQPMLEWLVNDRSGNAQIVAVFTQPDKPVGRGQKITPNAIKTWALGRGLPVFQPEKLTEDVRRQLVSLNADLGLVMAYGHILRDDFIATPGMGMLNLHTSLLPRYRGASPIQTAIANGEAETGVSLMCIVRRLDAGPVADVEPVRIEKMDTALEVEAKLAAACVPLMARALGRLREGSLALQPQDDTQATFCRKLTKEDGVLDFSAPAAVLAARIHGLFPWPSCSVEIAGQPVKIGLAEAIAGAPTERPGCILRAEDGELVVATADGLLKLHRLQRPGGRMLAAADFLRGFPVKVGEVIPSRPMPSLVGQEPFKPSARPRNLQ